MDKKRITLYDAAPPLLYMVTRPYFLIFIIVCLIAFTTWKIVKARRKSDASKRKEHDE